MHTLIHQRAWLARIGEKLTAEEVVGRMAALPTATAAAAAPPLTAVTVVAGIEVAATSITNEPALRRTWRERHGGGATPLLLLTNDPHRSGSVRALGILDPNGPLRSVEASSLAEVLERASSKPRLEAVRELAAELERLDQTGVPGLKLKDMLTIHTLDRRLRRDTARWALATEASAGIGRDADWRTILSRLGYSLDRLPQRGYLARFEGRPVAVIHPFDDPAKFARLDNENRPPEGVLINDCLQHGAGFGILASGGRLRLFEASPSAGSVVAQYLEVDSAVLQVDDRPFLGLFSPPFLANGEFERLRNEAHQFGIALRKRLDSRLRESVLPVLGRGLGRWARDSGRDLVDDSVREDLEHAALTFVFRALFLAYAEGGGHLPMDNRSYRQASLTALVEEASDTSDRLSHRSTSLWDRFALLVNAMRDGNPAWGVPAYNGALFGKNGFAGAATLEAAKIADPDIAEILLGLGRDPDSPSGVDYSTLEIGHLGHIYEGLLSLNLSLAHDPMQYDPRSDRYVVSSDPGTAAIEAGDLVWLTHEGGRKSGGVYYTPSTLVRHLIRHTVIPAFNRHLAEVRQLAQTDPGTAADKLFDFAVLDPACGSAHFLVAVVNELADLTTRFLAESPLPKLRSKLDRLRAGSSPGVVVDDVALIRRMVMKRCVFGVDLSPMGAEVAKISLWLASFVPGLTLAYLDRNVIVGNSLIGVARPETLRPPGPADQAWFLEDALTEGLRAAAEALVRVGDSDDRNPDEIEQSRRADAEAHEATAGLERLFNLWTADSFGLKQGKQEVELHGPEILEGRTNGLIAEAGKLAHEHRFLHWPLVFPGVFVRKRPGFDAVVGNPPWEEVTVEELAFYALFAPGLRSLPQGERSRAIDQLLQQRPELKERHAAQMSRAKQQRAYYTKSSEYVSLAGDPDLYKFFCQRYATLIRQEGMLGVVLPRNAFAALGSESFRRWLFEGNTCRRLDFLLNSGKWAFDSEPRYTVALVAAERTEPATGHQVRVAATATSAQEWEKQAASEGLAWDDGVFGPGWRVPLLRDQSEAELWSKLRQGSRFPLGSSSRWKCFPVAEFHETKDKGFWENATSGWPLWKGESFDQYDPHGAGSRWCPDNELVRKVVNKPRPGSGSLLAESVSLADRRKTVLEEVGRARVAFRDVTRATDSRSVRACLVPPNVFLTNTGPYLAFVKGTDLERATCLGVMNSLPFDWQARRLVETHLNFFVLESLALPDLPDSDLQGIGRAAARLSCVGERYQDFAESTGVEFGALTEAEHLRLRIEIDCLVACGWALTEDDLNLLLTDFTTTAVTPDYRKALVERFRELAG